MELCQCPSLLELSDKVIPGCTHLSSGRLTERKKSLHTSVLGFFVFLRLLSLKSCNFISLTLSSNDNRKVNLPLAFWVLILRERNE
jgi:hypothetical protein